MRRIIFHIDCNNAFLSWTAVNMLKNGSKIDIRDKYSVIGGKESERKGIVLAKSNLCKKCGVITGETLYSARRKCPYLDVYSPEFKIYKKYSDIMYTYLLGYSNKIERYSIDECFIDFSDNDDIRKNPIKIAYKIKNEIRDNFGFTVNIGIGNNKLLAKMASDFSKPDKVHTLYKEEIEKKMWVLDVDDLFMIGKVHSRKLHELGIHKIYDLAHTDKNILIRYFKKMGNMMWEYANGLDESEVETDYGNPKSISNSYVLPYNYSYKEDILKEIENLSKMTGKKLREKKLYAYNVSIWVKFDDFSKVSKQVKLDKMIYQDKDIYDNAIKLFNKVWNQDSDKKVRSLCVGVSSLTDKYILQLSLFDDNIDIKQEDERINMTINKINMKYGNNSITYANKEKK